ncbi:MAG: preprotein translocase subunit SecG [Verrucomicrobiales bacterium]|nr:preprotein translocase subunit SecG [Verrucomicrobiales bacterium]
MISFFIWSLTAILAIVCLLMVLIVLMQRPKQEGLGAAFGGGVTDQMWGAQTTNVLQKATVALAIIFFVITLILAVLVGKQQKHSETKLNPQASSSESNGPNNVAQPSIIDLGNQENKEEPAPKPVEENDTPAEEPAPKPAEENDAPAEEPAPKPVEENEAPTEEPAPKPVEENEAPAEEPAKESP